MTYAWSQTAGGTVTLSDTTVAAPTFTAPDDPDVLTFSLVVTDTVSGISSVADSVTVTVSLLDAPVADAGTDQTVPAAQSVTLHGSGSQVDNDPFTYAWSQTAGTTVTLSDTTVAEPTFTAPAAAATLTFSLIVTDTVSGISSVSDSVTVTVSLPGRPVADAGTDQQVNITRPVTLHGVGTQSDFHTLSYTWSQTGGTTVSVERPRGGADLHGTGIDGHAHVLVGRDRHRELGARQQHVVARQCDDQRDAAADHRNGDHNRQRADRRGKPAGVRAERRLRADGAHDHGGRRELPLPLAPGTYDLLVVGPAGSDFISQWYSGASARTSATHVVLPATNATGSTCNSCSAVRCPER